MNPIHALSSLALPLLTRLDPELAHTLTMHGLGFFHRFTPLTPDDGRLQIETLGLKFPNPVGLAAGFDKNVEVPQAMLAIGFGFVEAGTVTPLPQNGNPKPRIFRLRDERAVINRLGFNNNGLEAARAKLKRLREQPGIRGINIGANKDATDRVADYTLGLRELGPLASYVTVNISSPNTPGLRGLQNKSELDGLLKALLAEKATLNHQPPLLVKIAPDLDEHACEDIAELALTHGIDGLIISNTTVARPASLKSILKGEAGGLSGAPLFAMSTNILRTMYRLTKAKLTLVGVGGISSGADAYAKIKAGATLVQLYTALTFEGPPLINRIKNELLALIERDGLASIQQAIGQEAK